MLLLILSFGAAGFALSANDENDCKSCHAEVVSDWQGSHHAKAMMPATAENVLGDFADARVEHHGQNATFFEDNGFKVRIATGEGKAETYDIAYTFGVTPLQQYLVETEDGRYQMLPFAWDSRSKEEGGQYWFHVYPEEYLPSGDRLHWQQPLQNWNGMCADCHSSGLKRNYDEKRDIFKTTFSAVNVNCQSCHVGANAHAAGYKSGDTDMQGKWKDDLVSYLGSIDGFETKEGAHTATWSGPEPRKRPELDVCAACHSRRTPLTDGIDPSKSFLDQFSPSLLDEGMYFPDGQIQDEVYVWGSFLQSKMHQAGVSCLDCHDSHSLRVKRQDNSLCTQCHSTDVFDTPSHHKHLDGSTGGQCVNCHMPERLYMVVDARRDHSFKIPRPDISVATGSPNACTTCHTEQSNEWAADTLENWFPDSTHVGIYAVTVHEARRGNPSARIKLKKMIEDEAVSAIERASALALIPRIADASLIDVAREALAAPNPLMRIGAIRALAVLPANERSSLLTSLLKNEERAVRVEAARLLLEAPERSVVQQAIAELVEVDDQTAWRAEGRMNLALLGISEGNMSEAERQYRQALKQEPQFSAALINLSEMLRQTGREPEGFKLLEEAISKGSGLDAGVYHAFGLALVRRGQSPKAIGYLKRATEVAGQNARHSYVYSVALNSMGKQAAALESVKSALEQYPFDYDLLSLAVNFSLSTRDISFAQEAVGRLLAITPSNVELQRLQNDLSRR